LFYGFLFDVELLDQGFLFLAYFVGIDNYLKTNIMETENKNENADERFNRNQESNLVDTEAQNLTFNEKKGSYELDVESADPEEEDYQHPDPYETGGDDFSSEYDEANQYVGDEYAKDASLEKDADSLGMHIIGEDSLKINRRDEEIAKTPEDERDDLDEECYPKNI
jgi:hypothetical protein